MSEAKPPGRALLRLAGVFTQVAGAVCLLLGTIAFVLVQQTDGSGTGLVIAWAAAAMGALVFGGLMARAGLIAVLASALLDLALGITLIAIDHESYASIMRVLSTDDIHMVADAVAGAAVGMLVVGALCFASIPQAVRYGKWLRLPPEFIPAGSTERGFPPPPVSAANSLWRTPVTAPRETRSRRRMYFALAGFAIGFGAGIGVLVSATTKKRAEPVATPEPSKKSDKPSVVPLKTPPIVTPIDAGVASPTTADASVASTTTPSAGREAIDAGVASTTTPSAGREAIDAGVASTPGGSIFKPATPTSPPITSVQAMLDTQRTAIARGEFATLVATVAPTAIGFGVDADEVAIGRAAIEAQLRRDLGDIKGTVTTKFSAIGSEQNHSWVAQELEVAGGGRKRRFAITQLAAAINGNWQVVAWHWAVLVRDPDAERVAILGTKPTPKAIANKLEGPKELDAAVRGAFASRAAFIDSRSERADGFNFGSGPNERILGGASIKSNFKRLRAEFRLHDGAHVVAGSAWDPAQKTAPWIGVALVNADFTGRTRAATELTLTFRVMAIVLKEGNAWRVVQTQWSHGGPIR